MVYEHQLNGGKIESLPQCHKISEKCDSKFNCFAEPKCGKWFHAEVEGHFYERIKKKRVGNTKIGRGCSIK